MFLLVLWLRILPKFITFFETKHYYGVEQKKKTKFDDNTIARKKVEDIDSYDDDTGNHLLDPECYPETFISTDSSLKN